MTNAESRFSPSNQYFGSRSTLLVVCVTTASSYLVPKLIGSLISHPQTVWPLWPGCAILVTGLLLVRVSVWPLLILASFLGFALADLQAGVPLSSIAWFIPGNTVEVLISALGLRYCFDGVPRLNGVKALAKYSFFAILVAPLAGAFLSAHGIARDYWMGWKIVFLSEMLAFATLTPALLSWVCEGRVFVRRSRSHHLEGVLLIAGLVLVSSVVFTLPEDSRSPALFYALVPFLLWSALRFGWLGVSTSLIAVTSLSIWGAVDGRGPFSNLVPLTNPVPLQMFLVFAAIPFMLLAALAEEHERAAYVVGESEERLRLAVRAGKMFAYSWDATTDVIERSGEAVEILGVRSDQAATGAALWAMVHPDDKGRLEAALTKLTSKNPMLQITYRITRPDGVVKWLERNSHAYFDTHGKLKRVVGMVADVTERKQAEEALVELNRTLEAQSVVLQSREELLKTFVKNVPVAVAMLDSELRYLQVSDRWCSDNGVEASELLGRPREAFPEMPERWKEVNRRALHGETLRADEDRWESAAITRWARWEVRPWRKPDGTVGGILVFAEDITSRKQMQEELLGMSRKLIEAQEQERARIGRELHDDINQRLAMLSVELQQLEESPSEVRSRVQELRKRTAEISDDVQALSHELHASKLEYLGAVAGMKSWCKEFAERYKVEINFRNDVSSLVPLQLGVSLFRVLQEALHNAVKHSGVNRIEVQLRENSGEVHLIVRDLGRGFDVQATRQGRGLGLTSMQERIRLVNGTIAIDSKPMGGTTIHIRVPLDSEHGTQQLAV